MNAFSTGERFNICKMCEWQWHFSPFVVHPFQRTFPFCWKMSFVKTVSKPSADAAGVAAPEAVNPNRPLRPAHWKRWYFVSEETRLLLLSRARWWFFLIYPAWVLSHLEDYKPDSERIRRAYFESQMGSPLSPMQRMKKVPGFLEANQPK